MNILIIILSFMLIIYYCSKNKEYFTQNNIRNVIFDTNWYLRDNKPIIYNSKESLPIIRYGFNDNGSYEEMVGNYFRQYIYPCNLEQLYTGLDTIYKFINNEIDIAFIDEELLTRYIKKDCKYLTNYMLSKIGINNYDLTQKENIDKLYPEINCSAIGVGFYRDFYLIVNNFSNIVNFIDIQTKSIGILEDSYYFFIKICALYNIKVPNISIENTLENLLKKFKDNTYDGIFIIQHPKNKQLQELSLTMKIRFIHIQNKSTTSSNPISLNQKIKKYFQCIYTKVVDLNNFHKSGNLYSYLETYSTRMILIIRNDIPQQRIEYITQNYINNLIKMRDSITMKEFNIQINNFSSQEFNYNELVSFDQSIPLSPASKNIYVKEKLITYENNNQCII